jgi:uncharacterized protein YsxB (DUF464 family)
MEQYSNEIDPCNKSARIMLEYLGVNRSLEVLKNLIDRMSECKNKDSREFAKVYTIAYEWQTNYYDLDTIKFINKINEVKTSIPELRVKLNLLKFYGFYRQQNYRMAFEIGKFIDIELENIGDEYIKSILKTRFNEAVSYIYLRVLDNNKEAIKRAEQIIEENTVAGAVAYAKYTIGCAYMFESYDKSIEYFNKSIELYQVAKRDKAVIDDVKGRIDLLNVIWDKEIDIVCSVESKFLQDAKKGIMSAYQLEQYKEKLEEPFYYLIKGIIENSNDLLLQSSILFLKKGDTFFGNLPRIELLKRKFNKDVLNALVSLNQAA